LRADLVTVGGAALLVAVAAGVGGWLNQRGVPIHSTVPPLQARWLPHIGPGTVPAVLVAVLVAVRGPELAGRLRWRPLLALSAMRRRWPGRCAWPWSTAGNGASPGG